VTPDIAALRRCLGGSERPERTAVDGGSRWGSAARTDGGATAEPASETNRPSAVRWTGRWRGIAAVTLLAVAIGVLAKRPPLLLVGALTGAYVAYLNQGESPAVHGGRESDTPRHKPRSTLIQGYPL